MFKKTSANKTEASTGCVRGTPHIKIKEASMGCVRETPQMKVKLAWDA